VPEFDLIRRYFTPSTLPGNVLLGVGDDAALLETTPGQSLVVTCDTLVAGVHFLPEVSPEALGHKALAVNLSDLAAMGAEARWVTLALTLPEENAAWLEGFSSGFRTLADRHGVALVGGDTTQGPLSITVTAMGEVPVGQALRRDGARPGDGIYVSGTLGGAGLALAEMHTDFNIAPAMRQAAQRRLDYPEPRLALGRALRGIASSAIDISDGLQADLGHILEQSGGGATLQLAGVPLEHGLAELVLLDTDLWALPLSAGDDYELLFTVPRDREAALQKTLAGLEPAVHRIGEIEPREGLRCYLPDGELLGLTSPGYEHFRKD
jgi:thiamine-monophosphate kinase